MMGKQSEPEIVPADAMEPGLPSPENKIFYPALDGLRAIAVLMVFTFHYLDLPSAWNWGWAGVDIFFVLSGFLITGILYDSRERMDRYRIFCVRRALRIFPLYYLVLVIPVLLYPVFHWQLHPGLWLWPVYLGNYTRLIWSSTYASNGAPYEVLHAAFHLRMPVTYNLDHLWSLCVEEQFYLVWPFVVFLVGQRARLRNLCLAVVVAMPFLRLVCLHTLPASWISMGFLYRVTPLRADALLLGGAVALALRGPEAKRVLALAKPALLLLTGLFVVVELVSHARYGHFIDTAYSNLYNPYGYSFVAILAAALIALTIQPGNVVYRVCLAAKLRALGQRSYGFYVYHLVFYSAYQWIALGLCAGHRRYLLQATAIVALVGTLCLSWVSFHYFEAPFLRLKQRWAA